MSVLEQRRIFEVAFKNARPSTLRIMAEDPVLAVERALAYWNTTDEDADEEKNLTAYSVKSVVEVEAVYVPAGG